MTRKRWLIALLAVPTLASCGDATAPVPERSLRLSVRSGDFQRGFANETLRTPVVAAVTDAEGRPASGVAVRFDVVTGEGAVEPAETVTNDFGFASTYWQLGAAEQRTQQLGVSLVEESSVKAVFQATALTPDEGDVLIVHGADGPLRGVVFVEDADRIDGLEGRAEADTIVRMPPRQGTSGMVVFSTANRPLLEETVWTSAIDTVEVTLLPSVAVDFRFTVVSGDFEERRLGILDQIENMERIWDLAGAGMHVGEVSFEDRTGTGGNEHILTAGVCAETLPSTLIQVYFVTTVGGGSYGGYACTTGNVFMASISDLYPNLLAHEVGHVFSLTHAGGVMNPGRPSTYLSDGQIFQAHFDSRSALNTIFGSQPESLQRLCSDRNTSSACMPTEFDLPPALSSALNRMPAGTPGR